MRALTVLGLSLLAGVAMAQEAPHAPSCDEQVGNLYKQLATEKLVQEAPSATWQQQLEALVSELRTLTTTNQMSENRASNLQKSVAQLLEQLRKAQQQGPK